VFPVLTEGCLLSRQSVERDLDLEEARLAI
jgi:hypothetical protein